MAKQIITKIPQDQSEVDRVVTDWLATHHILAKDVRAYVINRRIHDLEVMTLEVITGGVDTIEPPAVTAQTSDGFHTFGELYDHRRALTAVLAAGAASAGDAWRSKAHHPDDSPMFDGGYFIVGIELPTGTITYHYKLSHWDDFAAVPELDHAPKWDGALPGETVTRLLTLARETPGLNHAGSDRWTGGDRKDEA
jgi:hypothetical protein